MSHLGAQDLEGHPDEQRYYQQHHHRQHHQPHKEASSFPFPEPSQDHSNVGRAFSRHGLSQNVNNAASSASSRSQRKPAPSPLHASTSLSPGAGPNLPTPNVPSPLRNTHSSGAYPHDNQTSHNEGTAYYDSDSDIDSDSDSSEASRASLRPGLSPRQPDDSRSVSDSAVREKTAGSSSSIRSIPTMAGSSASSRSEQGATVTPPPRTSSIDSALSTVSSRATPDKMSITDASGSTATDVATLIKTAGSAEAVIQYLLKEKQSQAQQNSQLWRLVDKQRAMILGLNKDLERALKEKEKYRKKLKEVIAATNTSPIPAVPSRQWPAAAKEKQSSSGAHASELVLPHPDSPGVEADNQRHSPLEVDVSLAPYPITPPADFSTQQSSSSKVGELLDPSHAMPKPAEHAYDKFDHEQDDREAAAAGTYADEAHDLPIDLSLPPSRTAPLEPPPAVPTTRSLSGAAAEGIPKMEEGVAQFFPPPAPPPRKLPPAPLQLRNPRQSPTVPQEEEEESDSDYDDILEVDEITPVEEKEPDVDGRGRRRTREEDDHERDILAQKEAEMRSLSKKSKGSAKGTPKIVEPETLSQQEPLPAPTLSPTKGGMQRGNTPASLAAVLNGDDNELDVRPPVPPALLSPGLPSSPRPTGLKSPMSSPPLSPFGVNYGGMPLSPRPPRQAIPLPLNTPLVTSSPSDTNGEPLDLKSPQPLNVIKTMRAAEAPQGSPTRSSLHSSQDSPTTVERTRIFKGFVTEEYPDLLLPPNALPSIDIKVASSRMKPSRASLVSLTQLEEDPVFTLAVFSRADGGELWRVEKDSVSLAKLDYRLKQCPNFTARTPDRSLFSGHAPAKLDARRIALDSYLDELLNTPLDNATALELCKYLSSNTLPPNADETGSSAADPAIEGSQKVGAGGRPLKNGYLTKRGKNFGGWKARYFVLDGPLLKYYETPGGAHLGTIKLQRAQIGKQSGHNEGESPARVPNGNEDMDNQYRHAFLILEPKKKDPNSVTKHVLCAESDRERDQWVETLLRWIDYRDPDDEEPPKKDPSHDRQSSAAAGRANAANAKRKPHGGKPSHHPSQSEDALVAVSYEATREGDFPDGVPHKVMSSQQPGFTISAPRDFQVISENQPFGSKLGMALAPAPPPTQDEKKARKRSFFGFGPKSRTSSDGQESLFGSDSGSISSQQTQSGPIRQVFGASLGEAVRYNSPVDVRVPLPAVVYRCIQYLEAKNAILEEGIFRLSGSNVVIKALKERFNTEGDINLVHDEQYYDIHAVASLLKLYLRELPTTILTRDLHLQFMSVTEMPVQSEKIEALSELVLKLPQANATLLKYLIAFLIKIINHQDSNKMTVRNVGIVFSPTLNIPAPVFALLLQNYEAVFGFPPEEYELPTPIDSDSQRRPSLPSERASLHQDRQHGADVPQRPSTSGSSPHQQRLMETRSSRSTPTPPPMTMQQVAAMNATQQQQQQMRSSPTPPPQRGYEPQFLAQQNPNPGPSRPAYEGGFVVPTGYDNTQYLSTATSGRPNPGYERSGFEAGGSTLLEQTFGAKSSRRESSIFMSGNPNLNSQTSKSRLRDEAQF